MDISPSRLQQDMADNGSIECWDDDGDLQCHGDIQFRTASVATSVTSTSARRSGHRDSISSRRSNRSERDSNAGDDEDWQVLLQDNEESITQDALASAKRAGIPIPSDVPKSALLGGTIKRLGGKKIKRAIGDDWSEDLELSGVDGELELKKNRSAHFPESLRNLGSLITPSPSKSGDPGHFTPVNISPHSKASVASSLDRFRDTEDDETFQDVPTIKVAKSRSPQKQNILTSNSTKSDQVSESFEDDIEFPADSVPLRLSTRRDFPPSPSQHTDDFDAEWAEGSIGVRFGGTRRGGRSNRSSSISAFSPSVSSCLTAESEDEGLDGLVLPEGPLDLNQSLKRRQQVQSPEPTPHPKEKKDADKNSRNDDFFSDIDIGDGKVFDAGKLTLNQNIQRKSTRPASPPRRTATTITFTNKPSPTNTRIPRLSGHERPHSTHLEPVSESGGPLPKFRRPNSRLTGHVSHASLSSIPTPSMGSVSSTPSRPVPRPIGNKASANALRNEPTTTSAQLLKAKRSMPAMRNAHVPGAIPPFQRPSSRQDSNSRPNSSSRPKTPIDRLGLDTRHGSSRRSHVPFVPAGASHTQSHHANVKTSRHGRRNDSDSSGDIISNHHSMSHLARVNSSDFPDKSRRDLAPEALAAAAKRTVTKPTRRRHFGDGTELEVFDDLPTSASTECKFVKHPVGRGAPRSLRSKLSQSHVVSPSRTETPVPSTPLSPSRQEPTPRFARDTNASRNAREQRIASMTVHSKDREGGPLASLSTNWKAQAPVRGLSSPSTVRSKKRKGHGGSAEKPHLIKPMGNGVHAAKSIKGMQYNPATCKWEGNENAVVGFDLPSSPKSPKPSPALITNAGSRQGVQVVGGMVFDPQRMCWLKMAPRQPGNRRSTLVSDEEEDVFAGLDNLEDRPRKANTAEKSGENFSGESGNGDPPADGDRSGDDSSDEWPITEEFDVGPEFIRRQRAEEEKWKRKVGKWVEDDRKSLGGDRWKWAIRDMVRSNFFLGSQQPEQQ